MSVATTTDPAVAPGAHVPRSIAVSGLALIAHADRHSTYAVLGPDLREGVLPIGDIPAGGDADSSFTSRELVKRALEMLCALDAARRTVGADPNLTQVGKDLRVSAVRADADKVFGEVKASLTKYADGVSRGLLEALRPEPVDGRDFAAVMADVERRNSIRDLSGTKRAKAFSTLADDPQLAASILRSPVRLDEALTARAREVWEAHAEATNPLIKRMKGGVASASWASQVIESASKFI
jgi:hypothetical protein